MSRIRKNGLTINEEKFIDSYIETGNGTEAYYRSYKVKNRDIAQVKASQLLKKDHIQKALQERLDTVSTDRVATLTEVLESLTAISRGQVVGTDVTHRLKALELLGKRYRLFTDRVQVFGEQTITVDIIEDVSEQPEQSYGVQFIEDCVEAEDYIEV